MKTRTISTVLSGFACAAALIAVDQAFARPDGPPASGGGTCCWTQTCPGGRVIVNCSLTPCSSSQDCSGAGGCSPPVSWAQAACIAHP